MAEAAAPMDIYQLKITLKYHKPPIWRRIQMSKDSTFKELHRAIISVMPWEGYHLHIFRAPSSKNPFDTRTFEIAKIFYDCGSEEEDDDCSFDLGDSGITLRAGQKKVDEAKTKLCDYFKSPQDIIEYEYDFGKCRQHLIVLEKILPSVAGEVYPICVAGKRECPSEEGPDSEDSEDEGWETRPFDPKSVDFSRMDEEDWC